MGDEGEKVTKSKNGWLMTSEEIQALRELVEKPNDARLPQ